jgi:PAS domain S-box-containing protein
MTSTETQREHTADEVKHLKACLNDLISILALPAMWAGHDPSRVTTTLLDMLVGTLDLDFAYVRANDLGDGSSKEWIRSADGSRDNPAEPIGRALAPYLTGDPPQTSRRVANPVAEGTVSITVLHLGIRDNVGVFVAGSRRSEFPTETERLLLQVATNQTTIALQEARSAQEERSRAQAALQQVEQRFRMMADSISEVIWVKALEPQRVLYTSPSFERIWGLSLDDLYRNQCLWTDAVHPEDRERVSNTSSLWITGAGVSHHDVEYRIVRPDGDVRWIHERGVLERDENGKPVGVSGISTDITERKFAEEAVRSARARFEGILEIADDAIVSVDANLRILLFNRGAERIFGYMATEVIGKPLDLLMPEHFVTSHRKHVKEFALSPDVARPMGQRREVSGRRKDGHEFPAEASISKLTLGRELVFTVILRDITERKQAEQRLKAQYTVTQMLAEAATLEDVTSQILRTVCEFLAWDLGELWSIDQEAGVLRCLALWHRESIEVPQFAALSREITFMPGVGLPGRVWSSRQPAYVPDVVDDSNFARASMAARGGLHAAFCFPILLGGEVLGVMDFFSREIRRPDQELLNMMAALGSQIGQFIERRRAEEALRRSEAYLAAAQKLSRTGSFGWDVSSGEIYWSEETFRIFEFGPTSKVTIDRILQRTHPEDRSTVRQVAERVSCERTEFDFEHRLVMPDGSVKFLRVVGCPSTDKGASSEFVGAITDITERKRAEEALQQAQSRLSRATQVATAAELSASVAHEVNQPLAAVVANGHAALRWLSANPPNLDRAREAIDRIVRDGKDAGEVVQRIRSLFGGAVPDTITLDVNELIAEVVGLVDGERARKQIAVETRLDKNLPPTAGDRVQLQQVILNLLLNGIEAMDTVHDRPRRIFIRSKLHQPNSILVEITDNGVGIADLVRIFEPFFTTKKAGMGMGLAISRSIIEAHHGRLWAEPGDGVGTTLCFTVPLRREPF